MSRDGGYRRCSEALQRGWAGVRQWGARGLEKQWQSWGLKRALTALPALTTALTSFWIASLCQAKLCCRILGTEVLFYWSQEGSRTLTAAPALDLEGRPHGGVHHLPGEGFSCKRSRRLHPFELQGRVESWWQAELTRCSPTICTVWEVVREIPPARRRMLPADALKWQVKVIFLDISLTVGCSEMETSLREFDLDHHN